MSRKMNKGYPLLGWIVVFIFTASACSFVSGRLPALPGLQSKILTSGLIAYVGSDGNIYTIDQNASNRKAITRDAGEKGLAYSYPVWSPDGLKLSYTELSGQTSTVFTVDPDGSNPVEVYTSQEHSPFYFYWSPDSQYVSFLSSTLTGGELSLQIVPRSDGEARIIDTGQPYYWDWSPVSQSILIHAGGDSRSNPEARLALLTLGSDFKTNTLDLKPGPFQSPSWSPRGDKLLLAIDSGDGREALVVANSDGILLQELDVLSGPAAFAWSPDGSKIALLYSRPGAESVLRGLNILNSEPAPGVTIVADDSVVAFFWSPDGRQIAYLMPTFSGLRSPDQETTQSGAGYQTIGFTNQPEGRLLLGLWVYNLASGDNREIFQFEPTDDFLNVIPFFDQYHRSSRFWSPDSQHLVVSAIDERGDPGIYVIDATAGGGANRIADGLMAYWSWK